MNMNTVPQGITIITGAAGGMGSATVHAMADAGRSELILIDMNAERLETVAAPLRATGVQIEILAGNIAEADFPARLLQLLGEREIGAFIHTAGISPVMGTSEQILAVNLDATVRLVDAVADRMSHGSTAVLFASNSSYIPLPADITSVFNAPLPAAGAVSLAHMLPNPQLAYPMSKLGVRALVKREAKRFGERGARLVSVSPGVIDTPMAQGELQASEVARQMIDKSPLARIGRPDELASAVVYLCSPAASFITGCDLLVDGGQTASMGF